ncbi:glycoside hydrolase family 3 N-terminal domain-containing protein [Anaerotignum sp.]|nr:glycoside hydrolase family 3 N-terminal domain-containing protein [Anaerotignum sp.]MBQ7758147.1 glycoside hydrolase [Anaerotignum sp.]
MKKLLAMLLTGCLAFGAAACGESAMTEDAPPKTEAQIKTEIIQEIIDDMTPAEKAGQLLMADFRQNTDGTGMTTLSEEAKEALAEYHMGGVILFAENLDTTEQTQQLTADLQAAADLPLFIGIDEEGGIVSRLGKSNIEHDEFPPAAEMEDVFWAGTSIGSTLSMLGINVDFAPVADVNTNPDNPIIGTRAFSSDPQAAADKVSEFISAMQELDVSACAKHFPGHGDTAMDSHKGETYVEHDMERLRTVEFVPFEQAIATGVDFIMAGHIKTPNATTDDLPASLSPEMLGILRNDLGFGGIIITDAMNMGAIVDEFGAGQSAVMAVQAGVDIVLMPADLAEAANALTEAIKDGTISEERVNESLNRILSLKYDKGLI